MSQLSQISTLIDQFRLRFNDKQSMYFINQLSEVMESFRRTSINDDVVIIYNSIITLLTQYLNVNTTFDEIRDTFYQDVRPLLNKGLYVYQLNTIIYITSQLQ